MSGNKLFLHTNIIFYLLGGDETLGDFLNGKQLYISFITELELLSFQELKKSEIKVIQEFIQQCKVLNINSEIKNEVINLKNKYKIKLPDAIIMASSIYMDIPIITGDNGFKKAEKELNLIFYEL